MSAALDKFSKKMTASMGRVHTVSTVSGVPAKVLEIIEGLKIKPRAVAADVEAFRKPDWKKIKIAFRKAKKSDVLGLSLAQYGIAETGTLVFGASRKTPASLNFVPEYAVAVVMQKNILETSEDVWAAYRQSGGLPHTLQLISGPSKTGDIEQTLFLGAHGPRELHVIVVKA